MTATTVVSSRSIPLLAGYITLLFCLGATLVLPAVDHHAAERTPWHSHVLLGGSVLDHSRLASDHPHGYEHTHEHRSIDGNRMRTGLFDTQAGSAHIISVLDHDGTLASFGGGDVLLSAWPSLPPMALGGRLAALVEHLPPDVTPHLPDPPPRTSL